MRASPIDERRDAGSRSKWTPRKLAATVVGVGVLLAAGKSGNRYFLGAALIALGLFCLWLPLTHDSAEVREELRKTAGPGWWVGRLASKLPGSGPRAAFTLLCFGIIGLGVAGMLVE